MELNLHAEEDLDYLNYNYDTKVQRKKSITSQNFSQENIESSDSVFDQKEQRRAI